MTPNCASADRSGLSGTAGLMSPARANERARVGVLLTIFFAGQSLGCTWTRFDDVVEKSPIQILKAPGTLTGLGTSVAAMRGQSATLGFAKGDQGYAVYQFQADDLASSSALDQGSCNAAGKCWLSDSVAAVSGVSAPSGNPCFAFGVEASEGQSAQVALYCEGHEMHGIGLPTPTPSEISELGTSAKPPKIRFASGPRLAPDLLVAAMPISATVWFYAVDTASPIIVPRPTSAGDSFGNTLAVAGTGESRFVAVGEPDAGVLRVMATDGKTTPSAVLCIGGNTGFTKALAAGHFVSADSEDLAVASDAGILVLPALGTLAFSTDIETACVSTAALVTARTLDCSQLFPSSGTCEGLSEVALAASDLDGDGLDELLIGAPSVSARGSAAAGKLLLASFGGPEPTVVGELSPSSAESGDRFGSSIVGVPLSRPEVVLAGAPGGNKLAALFCTSLLPEGHAYARCE
jgi:hypothetical protein